MNTWFVLLFPLACLATENEIYSSGDTPHAMDKSSKDSIIDFDLVKSLTGSVKNVDKTESEEAFRIYLEAANFDDLFDNFSETVHSAIEKRLNDALIFK